MRSRRRGFVTAGILVGLLIAGAIAAARPPPQPLCEVCSGDVLRDNAVEDSTVVIEIDERGTGHWRVRLDLRTNASVDPSAVRLAAGDTLRGHRGEATPRNLSVRVTDDTAVLTYDVPRMGHWSAGGVLVVDYFHAQGDGGRWYGVNADRVVITGPPGSALLRAPDAHRVNGTAVAIGGTYGDTFARTVSPGWYLTFADDGSVLSRVASHLAVGVDVAGLKATDFLSTAVVPTILLAACLGVLARWRPTPGDISRTRGLLAVVGVIGGLLVAASLSVGVDGAAFLVVMSATVLAPLAALSVVGVAIQYALLTGRFGPSLGARWLIRYGVAVAALAVVAAPFVAGTLGPIATGYGSVIAVATPTLFVPLALTDRHPERWLLAASVLVSPLLLTLGWAPYGNYATMYAPTITAGWGLFTVLVGSAAYIVSRSAATDGPPAQ
ncbi:MAG: hypothetical protein ABEJ47_00165 [Halorhabdus sp.]